MTRIATVAGALVLGLALAPTTGWADCPNLLVNGDLDLDPAGWETPFPELSLSWNGAFDSDGDACSGALGAVLTTPTPLSRVGGQCVSGIVDSSLYDFGGRVLVPLGESVHCSSSLWLYWNSALGCAGSLLGTSTAATIPPPYDQWVPLGLDDVDPPGGAVSVAFALIMVDAGEGGDSCSALFDDLYLRPAADSCEEIFADGVESEDTSCWSDTVPPPG